jgi:tetratricopeptide (TPR) repeat protein
MAAPLTARFGYASADLQHVLERSLELAESLGRKDSTVTSLVSLWASRFVQGWTADSYRLANRALALVEAGSGLSGLVHFAVGGAAVSLGMPAEGLRHLESIGETAADPFTTFGTRPRTHGGAWAAHAHWLLGRDDQALACCDRAIRTAREWALILDGWSRADEPGIELARRGIRNLKMQGSFARMPYWLSLLAELLAANDRPEAARATLDGALAAAKAHDDVWWLPEVTRMRAAYDEGQAAIVRLRSAAQLAAGQGSAALLRRCEGDLRSRGVRLPARSVLPAG